MPLAAAAVALGGGLLWAYWPVLAGMAERWANDPQYSHGWLVPLFALVVLGARRGQWSGAEAQPAAAGLGLLALAGLLRLAGAFIYFEWLEAVSLLPALAGLVLLMTGPAGLRWAWPGVLFLAFMLPLPYQLEMGLAQPLRRLATVASTYLLQTAGLPARAEGNVIRIDELRIGVVEACSGLGMLFTFFALSALVAALCRRPLADRVVIFLSAIPIGVAVNVARITLTSYLHRTAGSEVANAVFHDLAGWLMIPLAVALLGLELWLLARLLVEPRPGELT